MIDPFFLKASVHLGAQNTKSQKHRQLHARHPPSVCDGAGMLRCRTEIHNYSSEIKKALVTDILRGGFKLSEEGNGENVSVHVD